MKVFNPHWPLCLMLVVLSGSAQVAAQISVVPATGIAPRSHNPEDAFLDSGIDAALHNTLTNQNADRARDTFEETRKACIACHTAEKLAVVNHGAVFKQGETFAPVPR